MPYLVTLTCKPFTQLLEVEGTRTPKDVGFPGMSLVTNLSDDTTNDQQSYRPLALHCTSSSGSLLLPFLPRLEVERDDVEKQFGDILQLT